MSTVVNLRAARKRKQRDAKTKAAAENRILFGRSKAERKGTEVDRARADRGLDGKRRDPDDDPGGDGTSRRS